MNSTQNKSNQEYKRAISSSLLHHGVVIFLFFVFDLVNSRALCQNLTSQQVYNRVLPSILTLNVRGKDESGAVGSAFLALQDGIAVTAWHVVKDASYVLARFSSGKEFEVSGLVDKDEKRDVAIVRVKVHGRPMLRINTAKAEVGSRVYVVGAPKGMEFSVSDGLLSQVRNIRGMQQLQFSAPASPGNSGGPLLDARGEVLGLVSWQLTEGQNISFAIPSAYVKGLDPTLPTQPWKNVKSEQKVPFDVVGIDIIDKLLAEALIDIADLKTAYGYTHETVVKKPGGYNETIPSLLIAKRRRVEENAHQVENIFCNDNSRLNMIHALRKEMTYMLESTDWLMQAMRIARSQNGWTSEANDTLARSRAAFQLAMDNNLPSFESLKASKIFMDSFSKSARYHYGIVNDSSGFSLGVWEIIRLPLFMLFPEDALAYKLGFRNGDEIVMVNGKEIETLTDLKRLLVENSGKPLKVLVERSGHREEISVELPK